MAAFSGIKRSVSGAGPAVVIIGLIFIAIFEIKYWCCLVLLLCSIEVDLTFFIESHLYSAYSYCIIMVKFQSITRDEYKMGQSALRLLYAFYPTPFGKCLIAITDTDKAVVYLGFADNAEEYALKDLKNEWPLSEILEDTGKETKSIIERIFQSHGASLDSLCVLLKGTLFQVQVWKSLLTIPKGECTTYEEVAKTIDNPKAIRPVGNAISRNRIAYIVPCHRVTSKNTDDKYTWGVERKQAILKYERGLGDYEN